MKAGRGLVIAIDGPSGVGKTTVSRLLAGRLGIRYINTGTMYRSLALAAYDSGVELTNDAALREFCSKAEVRYEIGLDRLYINGRDYTERLRTQAAGQLASVVSARKPVREFLAAYQRRLGEEGSVVMEGRDIGTVVLPDADFKFFLDAPHDVRAKRRHLELASKTEGAGEGKKEVSEELTERDRRDTERAESPLKQATDAVYIDTGGLAAEEVVEKILNIINERSRVGDTRS